MKKVVKLKESDLQRIVKRVLSEGTRGVKSETNDAIIPLIYGLTYDIKLLQNGKDITKYIKNPPDTSKYTDIIIKFPTTGIPIIIDMDKFEVKFTPLDGDNLDSKNQRELKKIYNEQGFKMGRGESFPILSPTTLPTFRVGYDDYDEFYRIYDGKKGYMSGNEFPYDKEYKDQELYKGEQFNVYVKFVNQGDNMVSEIDGQNQKTIQKLNKEGWKESSVNIDDIINNKELNYVEKAGINSRGFAGVFIGNSENDIKYFIYIPGLQGYRGMSTEANKGSLFNQFKKDVEGVYEGGNYFKFEHGSGNYD